MNEDNEIDIDILRAAKSGNTAEVRALLDVGVMVNATDDEGITALKYASEAGHTEIVELLRDAGAK